MATADGGGDLPVPQRRQFARRRDDLTSEEIRYEIEAQLGFDLNRAGVLLWPAAFWLCAGHREDAKDLIQEVFAGLSRSAINGTLAIKAGSGLPYLHKCIGNAFRGLLERNSAKKRPKIDDSARDRIQSAPSADASPEELAEFTELVEAVSKAISELRPEYRRILRPLVNGGMSLREIADLLGTPASTVRSRLYAARRDLRAALLKAGWEVPR